MYALLHIQQALSFFRLYTRGLQHVQLTTTLQAARQKLNELVMGLVVNKPVLLNERVSSRPRVTNTFYLFL